MENQAHRPGVPELEILTRVAVDTMLVKVQAGASLTLSEQRALLAEVYRSRAEGTDNLNRLVDAREKFDEIIRREADGSRLSTVMLLALLALGKALGVSPKV